jgi:ribose-phosphate pyrophosphokinase
MPTYQFLRALLKAAPDLRFDNRHFMVISPDEGAMNRAVYFSSVLGADIGMFYKRRDYSRVVNGKNPIVAHEFLGADVSGKDVVIIDDMISSGNGVIEIARQLKSRNARRIFICATFGLFTDGMEKFDEAYSQGLFTSILTTNLVYQRPELLAKPYYTGCDLSKFLALIIDTLNHDGSLSDLLNPIDRINHFLIKKGQR